MWEVDEVSVGEDDEVFVEVVCTSEVLVEGGLDVEVPFSDDTKVVLIRANQFVKLWLSDSVFRLVSLRVGGIFYGTDHSKRLEWVIRARHLKHTI